MEREARSIQAEFPADSPEFRWPNQTCMGNRDGVQGTVEFARPEVQKFPQFGKVRMQVVKLPDIALQDARMIGHPIENIDGGQTKTFELAAKISRDHFALHRVGVIVSASPAARKRRNIESLIDSILLAAREVECCFFLGRLELNNTLADFYTRQLVSTLEFTGAGLVGGSTGQATASLR
jgi:hypothetical protein